MKIIKPIDLNKILGLKENEKVEENKTLTDMLQMIKSAKKIALLTHESPDGDAVGSTLAVYHALKQIDKEAEIYIPEYSRLFNFLPGVEDIKDKLDEEIYDLIITLDCSDLPTIVIDHHGTNNMYGDINFVNSGAPACAQVLITIFQYFDLKVSKEIGTCLVTGIITDTGGFQYQGITPETFEFAAELLRIGIDIPGIYAKVLQTKTKANFELSKRVNDRMVLEEDGKIAFSYITCKDEKEVNAEPGDHEGLVDIGRSIEGVEVSIFLREKEDKGGFKISMRALNYVNVSDICYLFGGGGHPRAAGCFIKGSVDEVKNKIIAETKKAL